MYLKDYIGHNAKELNYCPSDGDSIRNHESFNPNSNHPWSMLGYGYNRAPQLEVKLYSAIKDPSRYVLVADCRDFMIRPNAEVGPSDPNYNTIWYPQSCNNDPSSTFYWYELSFRHSGTSINAVHWDGHAGNNKRIYQRQLYYEL